MMDDNSQIAVVENDNLPAQPTTEAGSIMAVIERAALNPDVNIDKMERLFALHEKAVVRVAETEFNAAMREAQSEITTVLKNKYNDQTRSKYADIAAVNEQIMPVVTKHGFSISFGTDVCEAPGHIRITADVANGGHTKHYFADIPNDGAGLKGNANKTATHAFGSTVSYGRRYLMLLIFNVSTAEDDGNRAGSGPTINDEQLGKLREMIVATGSDIEAFCRYMRVEALPDIPAKMYDRAFKALEAKMQRETGDA
ncbi:MAG: ERF family protein [Anaerolineae bacterium]|nr:ERF family protein [Anaerolineae bacterium]